MDANSSVVTLVMGTAITGMGFVLRRFIGTVDKHDEAIADHGSRLASAEEHNKAVDESMKEIRDNVRLLVGKAMEGK